MITQQKAELQALSPQAWNKPTTQARVGDYIREPFMPIIVVVDKDLLPDGRVWLLVKPVSGSCTQEWILDPPAQPPEQQQQQEQEPAEPIQTVVGYAEDIVGAFKLGQQMSKYGMARALRKIQAVLMLSVSDLSRFQLSTYPCLPAVPL